MKFLRSFLSAISVILSVVILFSVVAPTISSFDEDAFLTRLSAAGTGTECDIILDVAPGGSVNLPSGVYPIGQQLDLVATPREGYLFSGWYDETHTLLSISPVFSFTVAEDRRLYVAFSPVPEKAGSSYESLNELLDCNQGFTFTLSSDKENALSYIQDNLVIADAFFASADLTEEEKAQAADRLSIDFTVTDNGDGTYTVTPASPYEGGTTYTATLPDEAEDVSFTALPEEENELSFTIEEENHETVVYKTGLLTLSPGELLAVVPEGEEIGFRIASLTCFDGYENGGIGATVRIDEDETDDLDTLYGEVAAIRREADGWFVLLTAPNLENIFEELDIYQNVSIDLEKDTDLAITDEALARIEQQFLANESVQAYLAASYLGIHDYMEESGYDVSSMSLKKLIEMLKLEPAITVAGDTLTLELKASINVEIKPGIYYYLALEFAESIRLSVRANIAMLQTQIFGWTVTYGIDTFDIALTTHESQRLGWEAGLRGELDESPDMKAEIEAKIADSLKDVKRLTDSMDSIKRVLEEKQWSGSDNEKLIKLPAFRVALGLITFNAELAINLELELNASISYTAISTTSSTTGFRRSADGSITPYSVKSGQSDAENLYLHGKAGIRASLQSSSYVSLIGFSSWLRLGFETEFGAYTEAAGILGLTWTDAAATGVAAGYWARGLRGSFTGLCQFFFIQEKTTFWQGDISLGRYGFTDAYVMLAYQSGEASKLLDITEQHTSLDEHGIYDVITYSAKGQNVGTTSLKNEAHGFRVSLSLKEGTYLSIENDALVVKPNAPAVFDDELTIQVVGENKPFGPMADGASYVCYAKPITVSIHYHGDGYVDNTTEAKFRNIYQNHNEANAEMLQDVFEAYLSGLYEGDEAAEALYLFTIETYTENLFAYIGEIKAKEDDSHTQEALFVETEPDAFIALHEYLDGILYKGGDYRPTEQEITHMLDCLAISQSCMNTLDDVVAATGNAPSAFAVEFSDMATEVQELVATTLRSYYAAAPAGSNERLAGEQIAYLLAISLS
ncbi:MAG: hypothetical protein J6D31_06255 [Clostridia bacterium]|nr:hypothetical protein [Clostridia bacterium]